MGNHQHHLSIKTGLGGEASVFSNQTVQTMRSRHDLSLIRERQADMVKKESQMLKKAKKKHDAREMKAIIEKNNNIRATQEKIREKSDKIAAQKWA